MTVGVISALGRSLPVEAQIVPGSTYTIPDVIQTDAPINPGNSGGVLVDMHGRLVGVPTAIESSSGVNAGIGFVVPSVIVPQERIYLLNVRHRQFAALAVSREPFSFDDRLWRSRNA